MKRTKKILTSIIIVTLFICTMSIFVSAAYETRVVRQYYSIPSGQTQFNADKSISHALNNVDTRFNVSVDNSSSRTITAKVYKWRNNQTDQCVLTVKHTGNTYNSGYFVPSAAYPYYVVITCSTSNGVVGYYSFDQ